MTLNHVTFNAGVDRICAAVREARDAIIAELRAQEERRNGDTHAIVERLFNSDLPKPDVTDGNPFFGIQRESDEGSNE